MTVNQSGNQLALLKRSTGLIAKKNSNFDMPVVIWNNVMDCNEECIVCDSCDKYGENLKCEKMAEYFNYILNSAINTYSSYMNEKIMVQIGLHLMPLYAHLFKLKLYESTVPISNLMTVNKKGTMRTHPIYKEIRDAVNAVDSLWSKIGVAKISDSAFKNADDTGDKSYIDALSEIVDE